MGAMPQEIDGVVSLLEDPVVETIGKRDFYSGKINGHDVVVTYSRIGKVAASATVSTLILHFGITQLIFTGVAGGIHPDVKVGDIVLGKSLVQHDMNASPLFTRYEVPLLNRAYFEPDENLFISSEMIIRNLVDSGRLKEMIGENELLKFGIDRPSCHFGLIASGDLFFSKNSQKSNLQQALPDVLCVEMEGAATAQVCYEFGIPFTVIRTISDDANDHAAFDFMAFIKKVASVYSLVIIKALLEEK